METCKQALFGCFIDSNEHTVRCFSTTL